MVAARGGATRVGRKWAKVEGPGINLERVQGIGWKGVMRATGSSCAQDASLLGGEENEKKGERKGPGVE